MTEERPAESMPPPDDTTITPPPVPPPAYTPPTSVAPAAAQPAVAWAPPPTTTVAAGRRTGLSLAAGILLVVLGFIGVLISLLLLTVGRDFARSFDFSSLPGFEGPGNAGDIVGSVVTFFGIVLLVCSAFYVLGGIGAIRSAGWGRVIGIVVGIIGGVFWLAGLANSGQAGSESSPLFAFVLLALHVYIAIALLFFWRTRAPA